MTTDNLNKPRMTCGTWFALGVFGILGLFGYWIFSIGETQTANRTQKVQEIFDLMQADNMTEAFEFIASDWQLILENPDGLDSVFGDMTITNIDLVGILSGCYTNTTFRGDSVVLTNNSQRYEWIEGSATINGSEGEYLYLQFTTEDLETKLLSVTIDDEKYGVDIPNDCRRTT